ncbi:MAG: BON domain-containing protein [Thiohalorhabdus sp.]|uniref:BON domain-containing protein n=1 Tax=Thiohalorhabdus sp. TaxID=3094134 RepID=UPI00397EFB82
MRAGIGIATALGVAGLVWTGPIGAEGGSEEAEKAEESDIRKELGDLGREIRGSMQEQGRFVGDKLGEWSEGSSSWLADRGLHTRVKTTLSGVLGAGSLASVNVDVSEGVVTLRGELESWDRIARAVSAAEQVEGVRRVVSALTVEGES